MMKRIVAWFYAADANRCVTGYIQDVMEADGIAAGQRRSQFKNNYFAEI